MNLDVIQGAIIALVSIGGGAGLQDYLSRKRDQVDRRVDFERDTLLDLQAALGDMAVAAEQIRFAKREADSWSDGQAGLPWTEMIANGVRAGRFSVLVDDIELQNLASETESAFLRLAQAASDAEANAAETSARDLFRRANLRIGQRVRGL
jgi:hypothetical protein